MFICFSPLHLFLASSPAVVQTDNNATQLSDEYLRKRAKMLVDQQKYDEAILNYKVLIRQNPNDINYLLLLGSLYVRLGERKEAIELYKKGLTIDPDNEQVNVALAFAYLFEKDQNVSEEILKKVIEKSPDNSEALAGLGYIAMMNGNESKAEQFLNQALKSDPKNITARIYMGNLRLRQHRPSDAKEIFEKLQAEDPNNPDVQEGLVNATQEEKRVLELNSKEKIETPLPTQPSIDSQNEDQLVKEAYAYLFDKKLDLSKELFEKVLEIDPNNSEALAGLGRIAALQKQPEEAERYYNQALELDPKNATALEYLAILKLQQKQYEEAARIYSVLLLNDPQNKDYNEGYKQSQELPLFEEAKLLRKNKDNAGAASILERLIDSSPEKIDYTLMLASIYVNMDRKDEAIDLYNQALIVKPNDKDLLNGLGFIYLNKALIDNGEGDFDWSCYFPFLFVREKTNLYMSKEKFEEVLELDPHNANALAGMGRIALIEGSDQEAEYFYLQSLNVEPENTTALSYLAALQSLQKKYYSAAYTYKYLMQIDPDDEDTRKNYKDFYHANAPYLDVASYYEEENEKNQITKQWEARLKNYGGAITVVFPVKDQLKMVGNIAFDYIVLKNLITGPSIYSLDIQRPKMGFIWGYSPYLSISGGASLACFSQYHKSTSFTKSGCYFLPYFNITYNKNFQTFSLETIGDAPIVARDFLNSQSTLIARQYINGFYEYDFTKRRTIGASASQAWYYNNIQNNQFQSGSAWLQLTPQCYWENISLRYQFIYGRFNTLTVDYYTYRPQTSHWIKLDLTKKWCNDKFITEAGYAHCWQRSFENGQVLAVTPVAVFHWVHREINSAYGRIKFILNDCTNATLVGTYSHDNFDYTTASVTANVHMEF